MEFVKEWIFRRPIFAFCVLFAVPDFTAESGTRWHRFLTWLYGEGAPEFDCLMPEEIVPASNLLEGSDHEFFGGRLRPSGVITFGGKRK
jgi:hypothetical protein